LFAHLDRADCGRGTAGLGTLMDSRTAARAWPPLLMPPPPPPSCSSNHRATSFADASSFHAPALRPRCFTCDIYWFLQSLFLAFDTSARAGDSSTLRPRRTRYPRCVDAPAMRPPTHHRHLVHCRPPAVAFGSNRVALPTPSDASCSPPKIVDHFALPAQSRSFDTMQKTPVLLCWFQKLPGLTNEIDLFSMEPSEQDTPHSCLSLQY
jgi:hypothetical protein